MDGGVALGTAGLARERRARAAVAAVFFTNGALFSNVVPRFPAIRDDLGLTNGAFGSAVAAFPFGALLVGLSATALIARLDSRRVAVGGMVAIGALVPFVAVAPSWAAFAAVMFLVGGVDAVTDVAQNAHGLRVQRRYGRSIVNSFHGVWSIGAVTGGAMGSAAAGLSVPPTLHFAVAGALFSAVALVSFRSMLDGGDGADRAAAAGFPPPARLRQVERGVLRALLALGLLAACGAVVEDAGFSWGAIYLRDEIGTSAATAGLAFVSLLAAMTVGRFVGDRAVDRFGRSAVARSGGVLTAAGMSLALAVPTTAAALAGYAVAGLGVATLVPAAMHAADELPGLPPGAGLTVVSWMLRVGFLVSAPAVGAVADVAGLRTGLLGVVIAGLVVAVVGRVLGASRQPPRTS